MKATYQAQNQLKVRTPIPDEVFILVGSGVSGGVGVIRLDYHAERRSIAQNYRTLNQRVLHENLRCTCNVSPSATDL